MLDFASCVLLDRACCVLPLDDYLLAFRGVDKTETPCFASQ